MPPGRPEITMEELQTFGDPDKVLQSVYEQALTSALEKTPSVDERDLRLWFDKHLVTPAGTRGMVFQDREKTGGIPNAVVEALAAAHIVRPEFRAGSRWYELAHDRFIRPIQTSNQDWYPKHPEKSNRGITDWERNVTPLHDFWVYLPEFLGRRESPVERDVVETMAWNISKKATNYMYIVETEENLNKLLDLVLELERHPAFAETSDRETVRQKIRVLVLSGGEQGVGKAVTGLLHLGNCWIANPNGVRGKKAQGYEVAWDETGRNPIGGRILPGPKMDRIISNIKKIVDAFPPPNFVGVTSASMESLMKKSPSIQVKCARD
jgi:hypothetical protein